MIHRELAAYHNYAPRMVLFPGWVFLILDIGIVFDIIVVPFTLAGILNVW